MKDIKLSQRQIKIIEDAISKGDTVEVKLEPKGTTIVRVSRKVIDREQ